MPPGADGKHYRTYGQAERFGKEKEPSQDKTDNSAGGNEVDGGKNVMMIKHGGTKQLPRLHSTSNMQMAPNMGQWIRKKS